MVDQLTKLEKRLASANLPPGLVDKAKEEIDRLRLNQRMTSSGSNLQQLYRWVDWISLLPWETKSKDILDLAHAKEVLDKHHYGLENIKERVMEYLSVLILQEQRGGKITQAPVLCFIGLVGTGKTTIAKAIAEALGRQFIRIPFGGLGDPLYLRGQSRFHPEAEPGQLIKGLVQAKVKNPVILLDEVDRVADEALNTIMGVLVELLDPEQNDRFNDYFIDYPFDLSEAIFVATGNNTRRIATAVLDRLEVIQMPSYNDEEKIAIGRMYLLPKAIEAAGLKVGELEISQDCWAQIIRPLGYDAGVRTLKRTIEGVCRKVAKTIVEGKVQKILVTPENVKEFLPQW
ncbi:MAG: AAA family ATPase [Patescibacteria group bacterium]